MSSSVDWDEDRISIVGQNGNTGEHYNEQDETYVAYLLGLDAGKRVKRKPLTDEELKELWKEHGYKSAMCMKFARAIEQAHGIGVKE